MTKITDINPFRLLSLTVGFAITFWVVSAPCSGAAEDILFVWNVPIKGKEAKEIFFPASKPLVIFVVKNSPATEKLQITVESKNHPALNRKIDVNGKCAFSYLQYPVCKEADVLTFYRNGAKNVKNKVIGIVKAYPITVEIRDEFEAWSFVSGKAGKIKVINVAYRVSPWHDKLKESIRFSLMKPIIGSLKLRIEKQTIEKPKGLFGIKITKGCGAGLTGVTALMKRPKSVDWDEVGWRLVTNIYADTPLQLRTGKALAEYLSAVDNAWPAIASGGESTINYIRGSSLLKEILTKYPDIDGINGALRDFRISRSYETLDTLDKLKTTYKANDDEIAKFIAQIALPYGTAPKKPIFELK